MVGLFFGKKALEDQTPFGLKRMSAEDTPELYPATTTEFAAPVKADNPEVATFRPLLAKTQLERKPLRLAYNANKDGYTSEAFHAAVDTFGAAVVVARTAGGAVLGAYNPRGWIGIGEDRDALAAFLFTWPDGNTSKPAVKLPKVGGPGLAVIDRGGIQFGAEGLTIPLTAQAPRLAKCRLGTYYERLPGGGRSLFAEGESLKGTQLTDLKARF
ncbi:hypothetical protein N2152v2_007467 [Parachlorella kessleri]